MITHQVTLLNETVLECLNEKDEIKIFKAFMDVGMKILGADYGFAWQLKNTQSKNLELVCKSPNLPFTPTARKNGRNYSVIKTHTPIFISDIKSTPDVSYVEKYFKSYAIIPLVHKKGVHGSIVFCFKDKSSFDKEEKALSVLLGNSAAQAVTIHRLMKSEQKARILSQKQEKHFRALIENSYEVIVHINDQGKIVYVSPSVKKMLEVSPKSLVGKDIFEISKDYPGTLAYVKKIFKNPNKRQVEEIKWKGSNSEPKYLECISAKMPKEEGGGGVVINIRDITEHKKLEQAKESERQLAEEKIKVDSIADATHELRTPLAIIKGNIDLARQGEAKNAKSMGNIMRDIDDEVRHLSEIVSDLALITSKPRGAAEVLLNKEVSVKELIKKCLERCESLAYKKNIKLSAVGIKDVFINGDFGYLEKMLTNLVKNSINYGNENGHTEISTSLSGGFINIEIKDDGIGISKEDLSHIFDRFYRGDRSHSSNVSEGTGLGLPIVKWIAETHKGRVAVKSALNKGSIFSVKLPLKKRKANRS